MSRDKKLSDEDMRLAESARRSIQTASMALEEARNCIDDIKDQSLRQELDDLIATKC